MDRPTLDTLEARLAALEHREAERARRETRQRKLWTAGFVVAGITATAAYAAVPHTFGADTPALATEVNANFSDLDGRVSALTNVVDAGFTSLNSALVARVPSGTIALFAAAACPAGWSEVTSTRGRFIVGVPTGGTVLGTVGTPMTDLLNPTHGHQWASVDGDRIWRSFDSNGTSFDVMDWGDGMDSDGSGEYPFAVSGGTTSFYTSRSSSNVPYVQFRFCSKT